MKKSIGSVFLTFAFLMVFASACAPAPTPPPTSIPPTFTPTSTSTPEPTSTPTPTSTPAPTYTPIGTDVPLVTRVLQDENFEDLSYFRFGLDGNYSLSNGLLILDDPLVSGDPWADGSAKLYANTFTVKQGNGYLLLFRTKPDTSFIINFEFGDYWASPNMRQFWFSNGNHLYVWSGANQILSRSLKFQYQPETWYYLLMWLNVDGVQGKIWEKDNPEINQTFRVDTGTEWANTKFIYTVNVPEGTVEIDEFQELEFSK